MILVTGGTGLVGAHLLLTLGGGKENIRALYRTEAAKEKTKHIFTHYKSESLFNKIEWIQGDIINIPSLEIAFTDIDYVYHCAAFISFDPDDEAAMRKVNIEGTANIVNCALAFGVKKLCYVSSIAALGDPRENETAITETTEWNPEVRHSDYAISKHGAEMEVWRAWQEGLNTIIVNPGLIFGYGFWQQGSGKIFKAVKRGQYFYTKGSCGVIAVEDVVAIMVKLMESNIAGERYTLVSEQLSYREIINAIADGMHKKRPAVYATRLMTSVAWRIDWLLSKLLMRKRMLTRDMAIASHSHNSYDNSKIMKVFDYNFTEMKAYIKNLAKSVLTFKKL